MALGIGEPVRGAVGPPADRPRPELGHRGDRSSPCACGWRTWGRSSGRPRRRRGPVPPGTEPPTRSPSRPRGGCTPALAPPATRQSGGDRCGSAVQSARLPRLGDRSGFPSCADRCQYGVYGWPPSPCAAERLISLWGTLCHHVESGVSRFIPSILARHAKGAQTRCGWGTACVGLMISAFLPRSESDSRRSSSLTRWIRRPQ